MRLNYKITLICFMLTFSVHRLLGQDQIEMADTFRGEGKIYVVLSVLLVILAGMFFALFRIEKKVGRVEKELEERLK